MKIKFQTKEESRSEQEKEFLALTPTERVYSFLAMMERMKDFPTKARDEKKENFVIVLHTHSN